jgi:zinc protease
MRLRVALLAFAALAACSKKEPAPAEGASASAGGFEVPALAYKERTLANGLRVYALPDASASTVSVQVWYDVGSKDDPAGRSGFAHLFEHILFKSTRNMPNEMLDRLTEDVGGFNNASTWDDFTSYYEVVPANHLERLIWAESERMGSLVIDEAVFASERDVVKEELRQNYYANPYGRLFGLYIPYANYAVHPYGRPGIGSLDDLDAATVDDVRQFHAAYYRPDNAVLVVAGKFEPADLDRMVDKHFGPIKRPARPIPRVSAIEPERTEAKSYRTIAETAPLPAVAVSWPTFRADDPDRAALMVLEAILSRGSSSRIYQSLVYTQQIAVEAGVSTEATEDPGLFSLLAIMSEGKTAAEGEIALVAEATRIAAEAPSAQEVNEAKNELVTEKLLERETPFGRASELAESVIRFGSPDASSKLLAAVEATTPEDVQRVAKRVFDDAKRVTIHYMPQASAPADYKPDTLAPSASIAVQSLSVPANEIKITTLAPPAERMAPPAPLPSSRAPIPGMAEKTLGNGLKVVVAERRGLPLISASLRTNGGDADEPVGKAGLADMTSSLLMKGAGARSAVEIAQTIESLGAQMSTSAGADGGAITLTTRADRAKDAFGLLADVAMRPSFADEEVERLRRESLDELTVDLTRPASVAQMALREAVFGDGAYGGVTTEKSLTAMTRDEIVAFHAANYTPKNSTLVIVGDISPADGFILAEALFGEWSATAGDLKPPALAEAVQPSARIVDLPGAGQAAVAYAVRAPARGDDDYFPTLVAANILGGGYSARLNYEIRIKRGLSYGARASFPAQSEGSWIVAIAQTRNDAAAEVAHLIRGEMVRVGEPAAADELAARKAVLIGGFESDLETRAGVADQIGDTAARGAPLSSLKSFAAAIDAVTAEDAAAAAKRYLDPAKANVVIAGDASVFAAAAKRDLPGATRTTAAELPLD